MNTTQKIRYIANHYGFESQSRQLMEECGELAQAVNKMWRAKKTLPHGSKREIAVCEAESNLVSEIADVCIMTAQIQHLLGIDDERVMHLVEIKLDREMSRIKTKKIMEEAAHEPSNFNGETHP